MLSAHREEGGITADMLTIVVIKLVFDTEFGIIVIILSCNKFGFAFG